MKIAEIRKGDELSASQMLSNRADSDFEEVDKTVKEIIEDVRARGDDAVYHYMHKFGGLSREQMGPLPPTAVGLLASLAAVWVLMGVYAGWRYIHSKAGKG